MNIHIISEIRELNNLIFSNNGVIGNKRSKRAFFNGGGMILNKLFGVLDEEDAKEISKTIQRVQTNEDQLMNLLKNQTVVIETTDAIIKQNEEDRNKQMKLIDATFQNHLQKIENLTVESKNQHTSQMFFNLAVFLSLVITEFKQIQGTLINTITDVHQGKVNFKIMSPERLRSQLSIITENLPSNLNIPSKDITHLYNLMKVQCRVNHDYAIFVVRLPLILNINFELYRLISLPVLIHGVHTAIKPSSELLMVDLQKDIFYTLSTAELTQCTIIENNKYLCPQLHPLYNRNSDLIRCEADIIMDHKISDSCSITIQPPAKLWIQLANSNRWLFSLDKEYMYNVFCGSQTFQVTFNGSGILAFKRRCLMKDVDTILNSHDVIETYDNVTFSPAFNLTDAISLPRELRINNNTKFITSVRNHTQEFRKLDEYVKGIHQHEGPLQRLQFHDIHQYSIGYSALGIGIFVAIGLCIIICKLRSAPRSNSTPQGSTS